MPDQSLPDQSLKVVVVFAKIRWNGSGRDKRGGTSILYLWFNKSDTILLLFVFKNDEQDDLTNEQLKLLKSIVENEYI
jgi:hypothetical protein